MSSLVGRQEANDIKKVIRRLLAEIGAAEPPIDLVIVRRALELDLDYFTQEDVSAFSTFFHRIKVAGKQLVDRPSLALDAIRAANLAALWIPDSKSILIDRGVHRLKHRWMEAHEIAHSLIPWHRETLFGDDQITLNPGCHAIIEAEANFGAKELIFLGDRFGEEARCHELNWGSIKKLAGVYGNTITTTFWRMVEDVRPDHASVGLIGAHPHFPEIGKVEGGGAFKHYIRSEKFASRFSRQKPEALYRSIASYTRRQKSGPIGEAEIVLLDDNGGRYRFFFSTFSNTLAALTFGTELAPAPAIMQVKLP